MATPRLFTERLLLRFPAPDEGAEVATYFEENQEHSAPWDPPLPLGFFTAPFWEERLRRNVEELEQGRAVRFFIEHRADERIVGVANFSNVVRGPFQACTLGYSIDHRYEGKGYMREGLQAALRFVFEDFGLHRVQANYRPTNERSGRLLRRLGFVVEGYARDYLFIDGAWRDHVLTSLTNPEAPSPP